MLKADRQALLERLVKVRASSLRTPIVVFFWWKRCDLPIGGPLGRRRRQGSDKQDRTVMGSLSGWQARRGSTDSMVLFENTETAKQLWTSIIENHPRANCPE